MTRGIQRAFDAEQTHPKVRLSILCQQPHFKAGEDVSGVVQLECTSDKVFLGDIWLELYGAEGEENVPVWKVNKPWPR